ncbi:glycine--tRNA ligase subunit beta [Sphingobium yanoikuyae]|uniref:Glycine--tRNA ligase beta subunit n=1 Tax=Sphingobium yanoikuyae TaxID=13690 RepID=A0A085KA95_SPHYA|nr:glycine--tRNA ligase subunit beta [Sphingobium yanoikuyae]AYO76943.1 glycine--tRNA ligase subunit beta [Sphingobium yanoikuyae]KFD29641.1 glycyl-tRNA synthetase subunit beta [Sphingobium yanoikuyae]KZC82272.1 glycine--tRNA ligase subunit beta [Sphingobium yanoikuyae]MDV3479622.1 glycine--tRNA ligase subunit beta [Sphingobium yanoikuyae]
MTDFLLELRCEEIPARMQLKASDDLARLFTEELAKAGLKPASIDSFVTPRRLALIARDLPLETAAVSEEFKGPRTSAPAQALDGFLRKTGLTQDQLEDRDGVWFAVVNKPGRATTDVLAEAVPAVIRAFPWPKSMRWGAASATTESLRWVRPLQGIIALLGGEIVPLSIEGVEAGRETVGHRFHSTGAIRIDGADDYADKLRAAYVIVSHQERQAIIEAKAGEAAAAKGYSVIEDKGLVAENAGLTEWPVPLLGDFDPEFLEVPPEVIQLTLRINQKYFVLRDATGKLAPAFICTANIEAKDGGVAIVAGNRKVLAARLSDARFFWQQDRKTPLAEQAEKLGRITFHEKLGTVADKVERVAKLAEWLASEGVVPNCDPALARQAAELCKADLVTEMVGEFPELQGVMGGYYARAEGLPDAVADAIRDHYKPVGQGDDVPTAPVTVAVSLADKLDTLVSFFFINERPTGSKDPFALRRAVLAVISLVTTNGMRMRLISAMIMSGYALASAKIVEASHELRRQILELEINPSLGSNLMIAHNQELLGQISSDRSTFVMGALQSFVRDLLDFFADRLKVQQKEAGVRHDLIDAVFALGGEDDLVRLLARVKALQSFVATDDGANLLAGYKRAANILKKEGVEQAEAISLSYEPEKAEADLIAALDAAEPQAAQAIAAEAFEGAMAALATLRAPIDAFFETVTVNDADPAKRTTRLALLARVRDAVHNVADFSKITG